MTTSRPRPARVLSVAAACAASALVLAGCGSDPATSATPGSGSTKALPKTIVFSPLSLQPPALKGLSEALKGIGGAAGWKVIVQDPNFDPTKQAQQISAV